MTDQIVAVAPQGMTICQHVHFTEAIKDPILFPHTCQLGVVVRQLLVCSVHPSINFAIQSSNSRNVNDDFLPPLVHFDGFSVLLASLDIVIKEDQGIVVVSEGDIEISSV